MMSIFVLRLISSALTDGRIVGEVEHVQTGEVRVVRSLADLSDSLGMLADPFAGSSSVPPDPPGTEVVVEAPE